MGTTMSPKVKNVHCKACGKSFDRIGWMTNKECDIPEQCHCPEVKKAMQKTQQVIDKAKKNAGYTTETTRISLPTARNDEEAQYYIPLEPLMVINIVKNKGK